MHCKRERERKRGREEKARKERRDKSVEYVLREISTNSAYRCFLELD